MEPILIFVNTQSIKEAKQMRGLHLDYLKNFYTELTRIGIEVTLKELISFAQFASNTSLDYQKKRIFDFVQNQLLTKAGTPSFNGVPINIGKLKDLIDVPSLEPLYSLLPSHEAYRRQGLGMIEECFFIDEDEVILSDNSDEVIENMYKYYTRNDAGIALMLKINAVCLALDSFNSFIKIAEYRDTIGYITAPPIPGISFDNNNGKFIADLYFVRNWEDTHEDYVLEVEVE